jgi:hypothetical protein
MIFNYCNVNQLQTPHISDASFYDVMFCYAVNANKSLLMFRVISFILYLEPFHSSKEKKCNALE